jgi:hypothetical protein
MKLTRSIGMKEDFGGYRRIHIYLASVEIEIEARSFTKSANASLRTVPPSATNTALD